MKTPSIVLCLGFLVFLGNAHAQRFPTNNVSQAQAIQIASRLWAGMSEDAVAKVVEKENGLKTGGNVGSPITGWTRFYVLANDCRLDLEIEPKQRESNCWLRANFIRTMSGTNVVAITLTNAPNKVGR